MIRRAVVGGCACLLMVGAVVLIVNATRSEGTADGGLGDPSGAGDTRSESLGSGTSEVVETEPTSVETEPTAAGVPVDYPDHYGFQDNTLYVALYGTPGSKTLGVLGQYDVDGAVGKAKEVAAGYDGLFPMVIPSFEIIASVASNEAGGDGDYSNEISNKKLQPWVDAADANGMSVVLDLQAGRARFDQQAEELEELLLEPNVGIALDPEWRVGPNEVPEGGKIGSVTAEEVNATIDYVDQLVEENDLPKKILIVHQFTDDMIQNKADIHGTDNVQVIIHMDGFGPYTLKQDSYARVLLNFPENALTGWKNFYVWDEPTPTPAQTMDHDPQPVFVSYQ